MDAFLWVGGHPCLDFLNTEAVILGQRTDLLTDAGSLLAWLMGAGLLTTEHAAALRARWQDDPGAGDAALRQARGLRAALRQMAEELAEVGDPTEASLATVNDALKVHIGCHQVRRTERGAFVQQFVDAGDGLPDVAGLLAEAAADLLCRADLSLIRRCENPRCILYFYDTTRNHARRWCSMAACGNRAKAAAHYHRRATERR